MRLATIDDGTPDGRLVVVSRDAERCAPTEGIAGTLQDALDRWRAVEGRLRDLAARLDGGDFPMSLPFAGARAPLPRAWQWLDGSAFATHATLMQRAFDLPPVKSDRPLMYQGMSDRFLSATEDVGLPDEADGIDFEGEFAVIVGAVPMGASRDQATDSIRLVLLLNDWSLRAIAPIEMSTGFGWVQAKPACSVAPMAVTLDELGGHWRDGRVALPLHVWRNGMMFGAPNGDAMTFGFPELITHAARTRSLPAGTIIGSGTVSNPNYGEVGSCCISERRAIESIEGGRALTDFLRFGERVRMESRDPTGRSLFGAIDQRVIRA